MLLLTTTSYPTMLLWKHPNHGRLLTPRHYSSAWRSARAGIPWAIDNDGFGGFSPEPYERMLYALVGIHGCLFLNAPDVFDAVADVGDHEATLAMWNEWSPFLRMTGFPLSFVLQNGATVDNVPWDELDAVFIGGNDLFKLGPEGEELTHAAKARGKHVHMGRVNSRERIEYAKSIGVDSCDGTGWAKFRDAMMPKGLDASSAPTQLRLYLL